MEKFIRQILKEYNIAGDSIEKLDDTSRNDEDIRQQYLINHSYVMKLNTAALVSEKFLEDMGTTAEDIFKGHGAFYVKDYRKMAESLGTGEMTLRDIVKELGKPGRDPREEMPKPVLRTDVLDMKDLKEGMILKGTVRNVIDFGAFVDIGVHQDGLVHISQMTDRYIKHPLEAVSVGDIVEVKVLSVDEKKKRISLTMKGIQ